MAYVIGNKSNTGFMQPREAGLREEHTGFKVIFNMQLKLLKFPILYIPQIIIYIVPTVKQKSRFNSFFENLL